MLKIGAVVFPGFELLDLFGPLQIFGMLPQNFETHLVAERHGAIPSKQAPSAFVDTSFEDATAFDVLLIPGGIGTRREVDNPVMMDWLQSVSADAAYILSVCTGSALLAKAGILDGRRATTNKGAFQWVEEQGPNVRWVSRARWVEDGRFFTSSGVSAGIDMALGFTASVCGQEVAEKVANWCEYKWCDDRDDDPFADLYGLN
ncbi:DJ-1/PfpI family protein [Cognatishimia sp. SS12]|uniref:DJ-1/PfpI family protein n=1 Tax=Cognatishimia sp. SS12 TaxID=2979465 RepID=UPI00232B44A2|nr:DJ-1/PfpI family protein [Cognatishimia sp. SS12]MDC0739608.1 DJ-1/PfpI family protein [Cognatishimia sp. SS12]